jgi:hypothetical protein
MYLPLRPVPVMSAPTMFLLRGYLYRQIDFVIMLIPDIFRFNILGSRSLITVWTSGSSGNSYSMRFNIICFSASALAVLKNFVIDLYDDTGYSGLFRPKPLVTVIEDFPCRATE